MAKTFNGNYECPQDGIFEWKGYFLEEDNIFGRWDELKKNCGNIFMVNGAYHIPVICPYCHGTFWIIENYE